MLLDLYSLQAPLPENIRWAEGAGEYNAALQMIEARLQKTLPGMLRRRLEMEKIFISRLPDEYKLTRQELLTEIQEYIPDFTGEELDALHREGWTDARFINGAWRYKENTCASVLKGNPAFRARARSMRTEDGIGPMLDAAIARVKAHGGICSRFRMRASLRINDEAFEPGETYRVHLPIPAQAMQQSEIRIVSCEPMPAHIALPGALQRTVFFERTPAENQPFEIEYEYTQRILYCNPLGDPPSAPIYPLALPPAREDLEERPPHMAFTPLLRDLALQIKGDEMLPLRIAKRVYEYITENISYSFMLPYLYIENGAQYAAVNGYGDCGIQSLLFITLCRILCIPARWQSGLFVSPRQIGSHDWAQVYLEPFGWLPVDCSLGGAARRAGRPDRWSYYFGNLDPYRMAANRGYMSELDPPKHFLPADPYDNQNGEVETLFHGLEASGFHTKYTLIEYKETEP